MVTIGPVNKTSPTVQFYTDGTIEGVIGNATQIRVTNRAYNTGTSSSNYGGTGYQQGSVDGYGVVTTHSANPFLPSVGAGATRWNEFGLINLAHNADGTFPGGGVNIRMTIVYGAVNEAYVAFLAIPRIAHAPSKPNPPVFISAGTTTIDFSFSNSPDNGGSPEIGWDLQSATDAAFTANLQQWVDYASPGQATGLIPGTQTFIRYRSVNAIGFGPWSDALVATTLPAVPPGLTVATTPSGTAATLTFTAPGGVTGVTKYTWERRVTGTTTPVATGDSAPSVATVSGLTPGGSYDWRASAWIGSYQSPVSSWQTLVQAKPNTNPGDYFDGSTTDVADLNYQWGPTGAGAANASISTAIAVGVTGWEATLSSGAAALYRVTAGVFEGFAARVAFTVDATAAGQRFGQAAATGFWADVVPGGSYSGSIYVRANRVQRVAAELSWYTAAGALVSRSPGTAVVLAANTWTRLSVAATAPATGEWAAVKLVDVTGTSWAVWAGGDIVDLDGAMITLNDLLPYFDGDTVDDASYSYSWVNPAAPDASPSKRTPVAGGSAGTLSVGGRAILDPACIPPAPPRPPVIANACVTEAGVWRRYYGNIAASEISDHLAVVPTFDLVTISNDVSQVRIRLYPNPDAVAPALVDPNSWVSEQIVSFVPKNTVMTIDGVTQRVWASVGGATPISADHLLYGSAGSPASWPLLSCGVPYLISLDLPVDIPQGDSKLRTHLTTRY